ncbi:hypothetical protein [Actinacidiphila glaucinigra]|nr:hypothetical protein [Actinacidiphila glaucinigra]
MTDNGAADLYGDGEEAKDLGRPEWQKSRSTWFTLGGRTSGPHRPRP